MALRTWCVLGSGSRSFFEINQRSRSLVPWMIECAARNVVLSTENPGDVMTFDWQVVYWKSKYTYKWNRTVILFHPFAFTPETLKNFTKSTLQALTFVARSLPHLLLLPIIPLLFTGCSQASQIKGRSCVSQLSSLLPPPTFPPSVFHIPLFPCCVSAGRQARKVYSCSSLPSTPFDIIPPPLAHC